MSLAAAIIVPMEGVPNNGVMVSAADIDADGTVDYVYREDGDPARIPNELFLAFYYGILECVVHPPAPKK